MLYVYYLCNQSCTCKYISFLINVFFVMPFKHTQYHLVQRFEQRCQLLIAIIWWAFKSICSSITTYTNETTFTLMSDINCFIFCSMLINNRFPPSLRLDQKLQVIQNPLWPIIWWHWWLCLAVNCSILHNDYHNVLMRSYQWA